MFYLFNKNAIGDSKTYCNCTVGCAVLTCVVDATWSDWTDWSVCSLTCGGGTQSRSRTCTRALHGGRDCVGEATETQACKEQPCPGISDKSALSPYVYIFFFSYILIVAPRHFSLNVNGIHSERTE